MVNFKVVNHVYECVDKKTVYLILDKWDDWFTYSTLYGAYYVDNNGKRTRLYGVKIGQKNQGRSPDLPNQFTHLGDEFFSLGTSEDYYEAIKSVSPKGTLRENILRSLNDIAFNLDIFQKVSSYDVVQISLLRDKTTSMVKNQYNRMALGGAWLSRYEFGYSFSNRKFKGVGDINLSFQVDPDDIPPTNIHVLIGKNGVGKTTIIRNMLLALENQDSDGEYGVIEAEWSSNFANIVYVSFSAFDSYIKIKNENIPYLYIGMVKDDGIKVQDELCNEFAESLFEIANGNKKKLWEESITILESDNTFMELNIKSWSKNDYSENEDSINKLKELYPMNSGEKNASYVKRILKVKFVQDTIPKFQILSSGHKVILLTVAKLIENVEEKTLVLLDEPEEHLHPPLVSAFIRALSKLLIFRNGVGIVATHSPVIVQEIPQSCVWVLRRSGDELIAERPQIETFGENLGVLTSEIFGYEVTNSGFHKMISDAVEKKRSYKSALRYFNNQLGCEGKTILRSLMFEKENFEDNTND